MGVEHLLTAEIKAKASAARKLARPIHHGYAKRGKHGEGVRLVHRLRAEAALGRPLPSHIQVHHADGTKNPDAPLVICESVSYHRLLHLRARIKAAGGDPSADKICSRCKQVKPRPAFNKNE